jgi:hypothetical protein
MIFVPPAGSLLHVADAITAAAGRRAHVDRGGSPIRSWDTAVDEMWELYHGLVPEVRSAEVDRSAVVSLPADRALTPKHVVGG